MRNNISTLKQYIKKEINYDLKDDDNIFQVTTVDSLFVLNLIMYIENLFDIEIGSEDISMDNLNSIQAINKMIEKYKNQ